jgi:hypothetical protein
VARRAMDTRGDLPAFLTLNNEEILIVYSTLIVATVDFYM